MFSKRPSIYILLTGVRLTTENLAVHRQLNEEKIRIVLEVFRAEESLALICRREGIHPNLYYNWSKKFFRSRQTSLLESHT